MNSSEGRFIIDAHFHLWRYDSGEYGWISEDMAVLQRDYLPADLLEEFHANGVLGGVAVQARQTLAETEWLIELGRKTPEILGVVGWVDLALRPCATISRASRGARRRSSHSAGRNGRCVHVA